MAVMAESKSTSSESAKYGYGRRLAHRAMATRRMRLTKEWGDIKSKGPARSAERSLRLGAVNQGLRRRWRGRWEMGSNGMWVKKVAGGGVLSAWKSLGTGERRGVSSGKGGY